MRSGSTQHLATLVDGEPAGIEDVAARLDAVARYAAETSLLGHWDGIACFSRLYHTITTTVGGQSFEDRDFLVRLDIEFARRYFAALRSYATDMHATPRCWRLLFDRRADPDVAPVKFAAMGVNAHINHDLAPALVATWQAFAPSERRRRDYDQVNDIFEAKMDGLREEFRSLLSEGADGAPWDRFGNWACDLVVRFSRGRAWDRAIDTPWDRDRAKSVAELDWSSDLLTMGVSLVLLEAPGLPV